MESNPRKRLARARRSPFRLGLVFIVVALVVGVGLFNKDPILTTLKPGTTFAIHFARDYHLRPYVTEVKVAGVPVGKVTAVEPGSDGSARVEVKVDGDIPGKLRSAPSAVIRPATLLGGKYYLDLVPGGQPGDFGGTIPVARTEVPVELDKVTRALPPDTLESATSAVDSLDRTLDERGRAALDRLLADAPGTLDPAATVLDAARGTRPATDLTHVVGGLESTARTLTEQPGQLDAIVRDLDTLGTVLGRRSADLADALATLPRTLDSTNAGLRRLDGTLIRLRDTADPARPVAAELDTALAHADPVLAKARPLVTDLKNLLVDARPVVERLVPTARDATPVLDDVRGPVLDRLNGPVKATVLSPYHGTGPYSDTGGDRPLYQELAYMFANVDRASSMTDANGASIAFHPGVAPGTLAGLPISLEQLFRNLTGIGKGEPR
ncbi:MlaD family protein [Prauserella oleivorans]|uniref:Mammalian cell entry protein n=7 Tax=Pseudonocardiaceae TaxID=2070 RepID=A0A2V4AE66_9PSEU|nr:MULTISPECIES: MlaD family protein [Pseudonocardiaceae]PXY18358.1 mammalian cell entry protein [Prauserella coralliicola]AXB46197.1 mammalian cell entry protein [Amycolatopsis albispora]EHR53545.1 ABC-type transport system involved in resistance to organic solvents, periplasmic component [Saccharomonospora marina XMU15]MCF6427984.1 MlaD family protein [Amycolatopsis tucumanensis]NIJ09665.1 phospholipid/cholesterol/gamma-HCH transport system substrate-binding protein [Saccharomonospora amisos